MDIKFRKGFKLNALAAAIVIASCGGNGGGNDADVTAPGSSRGLMPAFLDGSMETCGTMVEGVPIKLSAYEGQPENIEVLACEESTFTTLEGIELLPNLRTLKITKSELADIAALGVLSQLTELDISSNAIVSLAGIAGASEITELSAGNNPIVAGDDLSALTKLKSLNLDNTSISDLNFLLGMLELKHLSLEETDVTDIRVLTELLALQSLNLNGLALEDALPVAQLTKLENLQLNNTNLSNLDFVASLSQLKNLNLANNHLSNIQPLQSLSQLLTLDLENNNIQFVYDVLSHLTALQEIKLSGNDQIICSDLSELELLNTPNKNAVQKPASCANYWLFKPGMGTKRFSGGSGPADRILITEGITLNDITWVRAGKNLILKTSFNAEMIIERWFEGAEFHVDLFELSNGNTMTFSELRSLHPLTVEVVGGDYDGDDEKEIIIGSSGNDVIHGNGGDDQIEGGPGVDRLIGGVGNDSYVVSVASGLDMILDEAGEDILQFGEGVLLSQLGFKQQGDNLSIQIDGVITLIVEGWFSQPKQRIEVLAIGGQNHDLAALVNAQLLQEEIEETIPPVVAPTPDQGGGSQGGGNQGGGNQGGGNQGGGNQGGGNQGGGNQGGGNQGGGNQGGGNQDGGSQDGGNQDGGNQDGGNQDGGNQDGGNQSAPIVGTEGDDALEGTEANDTYELTVTSGHDSIADPAGSDTLRLDSSVEQSELAVVKSGNDLLLLTSTASSIRIINWFTEEASRIELISIGGATSSFRELIQTLMFQIEGTEGDDHLSGTIYADHIKGLAGDDLLVGGESNDILNGALGDDVLQGGAGADIYQIALGDGHDTIDDVGGDAATGEGDSIQLVGILPEAIRFERIGSDLRMAMGDAQSIQITDWFNRPNAVNNLSVEGTQHSIAGLIEQHKLHITGTPENDSLTGSHFSDVMVGLEGDDVLEGETGNDQLLGNEGNDELLGGLGDDELAGESGNDILDGGDGDDRFIYDLQGEDTLRERLGNDTLVIGGVTDPSSVRVLKINDDLKLQFSTGSTVVIENWFKWGTGPIENIEIAEQALTFSGFLSTRTIEVTGGEFNDQLEGSSQQDHIEGMDGDDTISAAAGDDYINAGNGADFVSAGDGNDKAYGGAGDDTLIGGSGDDHLFGESGNDELTGSGGDDLLVGGLGDDDMDGGSGDDTYAIALGDGHDAISDSLGADNALKITSVFELDNLTFEKRLNHLILHLAADQSVTLTNWFLANVPSIATIVINEQTYRIDALLTQKGLKIIGTDQNDQLTGTLYNDTAEGDDADDVISTLEGDDILMGGQGNDRLEGGVGNDTYRYQLGDGHDVIQEAAAEGASDILELAMEETDILEFFRSGTDLILSVDADNSITLKNWFTTEEPAVETFKFNSTSVTAKPWVLSKRIILVGTSGNDELFGLDTDDEIRGLAGDDILHGESGDDVLLGNEGNDQLFGGAGRDTLIGGAGDDVLDGGEGDDQLQGDAGQDTLSGGIGDDAYVYTGEPGKMIVDNLGRGNDADVVVIDSAIDPASILLLRHVDDLVIQLADNSTTELRIKNLFNGRNFSDNKVSYFSVGGQLMPLQDFMASRPVALAGGAEDDNLTGDSGNNIIYGFEGNDTITGNGGNDDLYGGPGNDFLNGNWGNTRFYINADEGHDIIVGGANQNESESVYFGAGLKLEDATFTRDGNNLVIRWNETTQVTLAGALASSSSDYRVNRFTFHFGEDTYTFGEMLGANRLLKTGSSGNDYLDGTIFSDEILGGEGNDDIRGIAGNDILNGGPGDDIFSGSSGDDIIIGGPGNDRLGVGSVNDVFLFESGFGHDQLHAQTKGQLQFAAGIELADLTYTFDLFDLVLEHGSENSIRFNNWFRTPYSSLAFTLKFGDQIVTAAELWSDHIQNLNATDADDVLAGTVENDSINAGAGNDKINGYWGDDKLEGGEGNDILNGGEGNDRLEGGAGDDTYTYSLGADTFVFGFGSGVDRYDFPRFEAKYRSTNTLEFKSDVRREDIHLLLDSGSLSFVLTDGSEFKIVNYSDYAFQSVLIEGVKEDFITFKSTYPIAISGTEESDTIYGTSGADIIYGLGGADSLRGEFGNDVIYAGAGDDVVVSGRGENMVYGGPGDDRLYSESMQTKLYGEEGDDYLEAVINGGAAELHGGVGNDTLIGGRYPQTSTLLAGGEGDDILRGSYGATHYIVDANSGHDTVLENSDFLLVSGRYGEYEGNGPDILEFTEAVDLANFKAIPAGYGLTMKIDAQNSITFENWFRTEYVGWLYNQVNNARMESFIVGGVAMSHAEFWASNVQQLNVTSGDDLVIGSLNNDTISGLAGDDTIYGYLGDDVLQGGSGNDNLYSGAGNDTLDGGLGNDHLLLGVGEKRISLSRSSGIDTITTEIPGKTKLSLEFAAGISASDIHPQIVGDDLRLQIDEQNAAILKQWLLYPPEIEFVIEGNRYTAAQLFETNKISIQLLAGAKGYTGSAFSDIITGNDTNESIQGAQGNDSLFGAGGDDFLLGSYGNDSLEGGAGDDRLQGDEGDDTYSFDNQFGHDTIYDYMGDNTLIYQGSVDPSLIKASMTFLGGTHSGDLVLEIGQDSITIQRWFDPVYPNGDYLHKLARFVINGQSYTRDEFWNTFVARTIGTAESDNLLGSTGDDVMQGLAGDDLLRGDYGNDTLNGGAGNDRLLGDEGDDQLFGGSGDDMLYAHLGHDRLAGGEGNDSLMLGYVTPATVVYEMGDGVDVVSFMSNGDRFASVAAGNTIEFVDISPDQLEFREIAGKFVFYINEENQLQLSLPGYWYDNLIYFDTLKFNGDSYVASDFFAQRYLRLRGGDQNDLLGASSRFIRSHITAGAGDDTIVGTALDDKLFGEAGSDILYGCGGDDELVGGEGDDLYYIDSTGGHDTIIETHTGALVHGTIQYLYTQYVVRPTTTNVTLYKEANDLIIAVDSDNDVRIKDYYVDPDKTIDRVIFTDKTVVLKDFVNQSNVIVR